VFVRVSGLRAASAIDAFHIKISLLLSTFFVFSNPKS
jgi:hypothetical protein